MQHTESWILLLNVCAKCRSWAFLNVWSGCWRSAAFRLALEGRYYYLYIIIYIIICCPLGNNYLCFGYIFPNSNFFFFFYPYSNLAPPLLVAKFDYYFFQHDCFVFVPVSYWLCWPRLLPCAEPQLRLVGEVVTPAPLQRGWILRKGEKFWVFYSTFVLLLLKGGFPPSLLSIILHFKMQKVAKFEQSTVRLMYKWELPKLASSS